MTALNNNRFLDNITGLNIKNRYILFWKQHATYTRFLFCANPYSADLILCLLLPVWNIFHFNRFFKKGKSISLGFSIVICLGDLPFNGWPRYCRYSMQSLPLFPEALGPPAISSSNADQPDSSEDNSFIISIDANQYHVSTEWKKLLCQLLVSTLGTCCRFNFYFNAVRRNQIVWIPILPYGIKTQQGLHPCQTVL